MICISVAEPTVESALAVMARAEAEADLFEIRLDALEKPAVAPFFTGRKRPLLFTFRAREEGGLREVPVSERLRWLCEAAALGADYVDLELSAGPEAIRELLKASQSTKLILSYHNFEKTPTENQLKDKVKEMVEMGAALGKVVCMVKRAEEGLRLLELIPWARERWGFSVLAFGMGSLGKWTRVASVLLGAPFGYAAAGLEKATAPGQLTAAQWREALRLLS